MNFARLFLLGGLVAALPLHAVYAPLPEPALEKSWTVSLRAGVLHDSNIFGAAEDEISSLVWQAAPRMAFNGSLGDRTYAEASYQLSLDHFENRPGRQLVDSHAVALRLAHAFSAVTNLDVSEQVAFNRNPESLLAGVPINTDQSHRRNEANLRFTTSPVPKGSVMLKARAVNYAYDAALLARNVDRDEVLAGVAGSYDLQAAWKGVAEYRREEIYYRKAGGEKNKETDFVMGGFDYAVAKRVTVSTRAGYQWRARASQASTAAPYAEFSAKRDYGERSFVAAGYSYSFDETANTAVYTDTKINRGFVNVQHALSGLLVASGSLTYEPSQLQGRRGRPSLDETSTRVGGALTWTPTVHWAVSLSYDFDRVDSDDAGRDQRRERVGVSGSCTY